MNKTQFASVANKVYPNAQIKDVVRLVGGVSKGFCLALVFHHIARLTW